MAEMAEMVNVLPTEDASVRLKIEKTAERLQEKYSTKRKVNEKKLLKDIPKWKRVLSVITDILLILVALVCCLFGVTSFLFKLKHIPPTFAGYSFMQIQTGSMVADGFDVHEAIVVRKVDTKTLNVGDNIAFFVYNKDYNKFKSSGAQLIEKEVTEHKYPMNANAFFGIPSADITAAAEANSSLVFHKIIRIYQDETGTYWFQTKGASVLREDNWQISERMVVGIYDGSPTAQTFSKVLQALSNNLVIMAIIAIPLVLMTISLVFKCIKQVQLAKLELDCVEEKRKITDEICVKNNIGFNMSKSSKYKVLAQASPNERLDYLSLLWKDGSAPTSIRKYVLRKYLTLKPMEKLLEVNRTCEKMYAEGKDGKVIAKYYLEEKEKIEQQQIRYKNLFKKLRNQNKKAKIEEIVTKDNFDSEPEIKVEKALNKSLEQKSSEPKTKKVSKATGVTKTATKKAASKTVAKNDANKVKASTTKTTAKKSETKTTKTSSSTTKKVASSKAKNNIKKVGSKTNSKQTKNK